VEERSRNGGNDQKTTENMFGTRENRGENDGEHGENDEERRPPRRKNVENVKDEDRFCSPTFSTSAVATHAR
jgi:hypothetical protein